MRTKSKEKVDPFFFPYTIIVRKFDKAKCLCFTCEVAQLLKTRIVNDVDFVLLKYNVDRIACKTMCMPFNMIPVLECLVSLDSLVIFFVPLYSAYLIFFPSYL